MHHYVAGERHGEVIAEPLLTGLIGKVNSIALQEFLVGELPECVPGVKHLEEKAISLLPVLTHQGRELLHGRGLDLSVAVESVDLADGVKDIVTTSHLYGAKVPHALRYRWFLHLLYVDRFVIYLWESQSLRWSTTSTVSYSFRSSRGKVVRSTSSHSPLSSFGKNTSASGKVASTSVR